MLKEDNNVIREEFFSPKLVPFENKNLYQGFVAQRVLLGFHSFLIKILAEIIV